MQTAKFGDYAAQAFAIDMLDAHDLRGVYVGKMHGRLITPRARMLARGCFFASGSGHAAALSRISGNVFPAAFAANRRCAIRDCGMPILRQLCTVETGASIRFATTVVPPKVSIIYSAVLFMLRLVRYSQVNCKRKVAIIAFAYRKSISEYG